MNNHRQISRTGIQKTVQSTETSMNYKTALATPNVGQVHTPGNVSKSSSRNYSPMTRQGLFNDVVYNSVTGGRIEINSVLNLQHF